MNWTPSFLPALAVAVLATGAGLKIERYAAGEARAAPAMPVVEAFLHHRGWTPAGHAENRAGGLYTWKAYTRADCARPLIVALLGAGTEAADLVRLDHGGDIAFLQAGQLRASPSGLDRQRAQLMASLGRVFGLDGSPTLPLIAISPAPGHEALACQGPGAAEWIALRQHGPRAIPVSPLTLSQPR